MSEASVRGRGDTRLPWSKASVRVTAYLGGLACLVGSVRRADGAARGTIHTRGKCTIGGKLGVRNTCYILLLHTSS